MADIVFAIDASSSMSPENYFRTEAFVQKVISQMNIDRETGMQVGVTTYSTGNRVRIMLNDYDDTMALVNAVNFPQLGGSTETGTALQ